MSRHAIASAETRVSVQPPGPAIGLFGHRWQVRINPAYLTAFPLDTFNNYDAFTSQLGAVIKNEARTKIIQITDPRASSNSKVDSFVLKEYRYPVLARLRTWNVLSKAEREFQGLTLFKHWGIPSVEPAACGTRRGASGMVESCFVLTRLESRTTTLRDWLKGGGAETKEGMDRLGVVLHEIGESLRTSHAKRFFLFAAASKDILVRDDGRGPLSWRFVDLPYSRYLYPNYLARLGQRRDVGALAGSIIKLVGEDVFESFYSSYLSDPLGASEISLRQRVLRGGRIHNHETHMVRIRRGLKRQLKKASRLIRSAEERR